jgi:hypothetical protein
MKKFAWLAAAASLFALPAAAQAPSGSDGGWQFSLTPYLWLPSVSGTLNYDVPPGAGGGPGVDVGGNDYLQNLESALMLGGEARKGSWAIFSDLILLEFGNEKAEIRGVSGPGGVVQVPLNVNTTTSLEGVLWQLAVSHAISHSPANTFEVLGGFRYFAIESTLDWQLAGPIGLFPQSGSFSQKEDLLDAIVGVRGKLRFGDGNRWLVPYYLDAGAGAAKLTWQAMAGIGHGFKWGDVLFTYRHLSYEQESDEHLQDLSFSGPALGAAFRF